MWRKGAMRSLIALLILVCSLPAAAQRDGNLMVRACHLAVDHENGQRLSEDQTTDALSCISYIAGFRDALQLVSQLGKSNIAFCPPPDGLSATQAARVYVKYLDAHPEKLQEAPATLLALSLVEAFPCKVPPQK